MIAALKLKGDPVLAMVEIDNETSLLQAWGSRQLEKAILGIPPHAQHDDHVFEMSPAKQHWSLLIHGLTLSNHGHSCLQQSPPIN